MINSWKPEAEPETDTAAVARETWTKPVIEDFNTKVEGGSIAGASDVSVFHS